MALIMCRAWIISMDGGAVWSVLVSSQGTMHRVDHPLLSPPSHVTNEPGLVTKAQVNKLRHKFMLMNTWRISANASCKQLIQIIVVSKLI